MKNRLFRVLALICALLLSVCLAEEAALTPEALIGEWQVEVVYENNTSMHPAQYGMTITLTMREDGTAFFDYAGDVVEGLSWTIEEGTAWLAGYSDEPVALSFTQSGAMCIADSIGTMYLVRPEAE